MADAIESLNFEVILDDKKFDEQIEKIKQKANDLNTSLSNILEIHSKLGTKQIISTKGVENAKELVPILKEIRENMDKLPNGVKVFNKELENTGKTVERTRDLMSDFSRLTGIAFGVVGARNFLGSMVRVTGEFEVQKMALRSMLQDQEKADAIFSELRKNALESPYTFQDLSKYAKQLAAFNIDADQLVETEKRLADVAAGLGVDMGRIVLAYGQVKSAGVLKGTELRQFTEAGVPVLQALADQIEMAEGKAVSLSEVFDRISKKQIPFEMVEQAFRDMTSEGGKFYNMQEVLVETLQGKIGKLRDVWQQMLYEIGNANSGVLKGAVDSLTWLISHFQTIGAIISPLIKGFGAYAATLGVAAVAQKALVAAEFVAGFKGLVKSLKSAKTAAEGLALAANKVSVVIGAAFAIYGIVQSIIDKTTASQKRLTAEITSFDNEVDKETRKLGELKGTLETTKKGSEEWAKAKDEIVKNYGQYFSGLDQEVTKVGDLSTSYDKLVASIKESIAARRFDSFRQNEESIFENVRETQFKKIQEGLYKKLGDDYYVVFRGLVDTVNENIGNSTDAVAKYIDDHRLQQDFGVGFANKIDKAYNQYARNIQMAIERLGLIGTEFDPNFVGPILKKLDDATVNQTWTPKPPKGKTQDQKDIETQIDAIKELQRAYNDLVKGGFDEQQVKSLIGDYFSWLDASIRDRTDFWAELMEYADKLEQYDKEAAAKLRADVARGQAKEVGDANKKTLDDNRKATEKAIKDYESLEKKITEYLSKEYTIEGEKASAKISKMLTDLFNKNVKVELDTEELVKGLDSEETKIAVKAKFIEGMDANERASIGEEAAERMAESYWEDWVKRMKDAVRQQAKTQKDYNNKTAKESIRGMADKIFKEQMSGFDLTNWTDKSLADIYRIREAISKVELTPEIKAALGDNLELAEMLVAELNKIKDDTLSNTVDHQIYEKWVNQTGKIAGNIGEAAEMMQKLADATGSDALSTLASITGDLAKNLQAASEGAKAWGGWWGAIIGGSTDIISGITDAVNRSSTITEAISNFKEELRMANLRDALDLDSIFGSNEMGAVDNAVKQLDELKEHMEGLGDVMINTGKASTRGLWKAFVMGVRKYFNPKHISDLELGEHSITDIIESMGLEVYDEYGNIAAESIRKVIDELEIQDERLVQLANDSEAYANAMKKIEEVADSVFGEIAESAADTIVDQWIEARDAALDYADILDDVARQYAKLLVKQALFDNVFTEDRTNEILQKFMHNDYSGAMAAVDALMQDVSALGPTLEGILTAFDPYFQTGDSSSSLGSGISSITEDTAGLLASYINAMRADLSVMRGLQQTGWIDVKGIHDMIQSQMLPNYNEYMAQVAANTYDTAQSNQLIYAELHEFVRDVVTSGPEGRAVKTL